MSILDFIVLFGTLLFIVIYGSWKTRKNKDLEGYLLGDNTMKWGTIGLSVMATQASAITFLSTPGQAYESGMAFVQNYFGLPLALIIVSVFFIPLYYKLKVFTAYEFLEKRFDIKTRLLGAFLFCVQRGLAAGITIYAPAIILSSIIGWNLTFTILLVGILVIIYTVTGGTKAVSLTQKYQMGVIMTGMLIAFFLVIDYLPDYLSFGDAVMVAGKMGKLEVVDFSLDFSKRYTFWSGITGGLFLALSYFGTDQSQVQRYISGKNVSESRLGLMFNALLKVPMQFFILFVGVMVFIFYQFEKPPVFFKESATKFILSTEYAQEFKSLDDQYSQNFEQKKAAIQRLIETNENGNLSDFEAAQTELQRLDQNSQGLRKEVKELLVKANPEFEIKDSDYVFLTFIIKYMPQGIVGLLIAVIFSAAMSSTSSELNALASTTTVDFYRRLANKSASPGHYLLVSKLLTVFWGALAITFALFAFLVENLIEAVNIVGSLFYGTILGIFLVAFFVKYIKGNAVFIAALIAEGLVVAGYVLSQMGYFSLGYLWYNVIGCALTIIIGLLFQWLINRHS